MEQTGFFLIFMVAGPVEDAEMLGNTMGDSRCVREHLSRAKAAWWFPSLVRWNCEFGAERAGRVAGDDRCGQACGLRAVSATVEF